MFCASLIGTILYAQNEKDIDDQNSSYILLLSEDRLYGKISVDIKGHVVLKNKADKTKEKYTPSEIIGYYDAKKGNDYVTINPEDDNHGPWLYQRKANGIIKFYSYTFENSNGGKFPFYYIEKGDSGLQRTLSGSVIRMKKEKALLEEFMKDYQDLYQIVKKKSFNEKNLIKIINQYNDWHEDQAIK